jgi:hypothetical protein
LSERIAFFHLTNRNHTIIIVAIYAGLQLLQAPHMLQAMTVPDDAPMSNNYTDP